MSPSQDREPRNSRSKEEPQHPIGTRHFYFYRQFANPKQFWGGARKDPPTARRVWPLCLVGSDGVEKNGD